MLKPELTQRFLDLYPWPDDSKPGSQPYELLNKYELSGSTDDIWHLISDTSRLNRQLRIPSAVFSEADGARYGQAEYFGIKNHWREPPWERSMTTR
jgi:hypothetical protein